MSTIVSTVAPSVFIILSDEVREHLKRHFGNDLPGSKFEMESPEQLLQAVLDRFSEKVAGSVADDQGIKIVSVKFEKEIGTSNVVPIDELTEEELATLQTVPRGETMARCAKSNRVFPTCECQLIMDSENNLITAYPGELAPPLPDSPDIHDEYWDNHVFIESSKEKKY
jgi:hypothetical protein